MPKTKLKLVKKIARKVKKTMTPRGSAFNVGGPNHPDKLKAA